MITLFHANALFRHMTVAICETLTVFGFVVYVVVVVVYARAIVFRHSRAKDELRIYVSDATSC